MKRLAGNLLVQFSLASFVMLIVVGVILVQVLSSKLRQHAVDDLVDEAIGASAGRLLSGLEPADFDTPMTGERYDRFSDFVEQSIASERTARVKLYSRDGTVIFSNDPASVGEQFPQKPNLLTALAGDNAVEINIADDAENAGERRLGTLMEVYTPVIFEGESEPRGAFEIYQYYEPTAEHINQMRRWVFGSIGTGFFALYAVLVFVVWGGWRTITGQRGQLESVNSELSSKVQEAEAYNRQLTSEVSERRRAEEALRQQAGELERSNSELRQLTYGTSHDLQEPLRMVSIYTQLLAKRYNGKLDSDADDFISFAVDGVDRMKALVDDLGAYSRVGPRDGSSGQTDCEAAFDSAAAGLKHAIEECQAEVTRDSLPTLAADASELTQVFEHLIGNALKFNRNVPPRIHASARVDERVALFSVSDNGIGIEAEYLGRIFDMFQRLHTRGDYAGTGIGLAICRRIIESHGGRIWVESTPGAGTTFHFTIPTEGDRTT